MPQENVEHLLQRKVRSSTESLQVNTWKLESGMALAAATHIYPHLAHLSASKSLMLCLPIADCKPTGIRAATGHANAAHSLMLEDQACNAFLRDSLYKLGS